MSDHGVMMCKEQKSAALAAGVQRTKCTAVNFCSSHAMMTSVIYSPMKMQNKPS